MNERMQGKTALITGATSNIGRAIAVAFGAQGANVVLSGRDASRGAEVVKAIQDAGGHGQFLAAALDGSARTSHELADAARDALGGRIDVLVNNAGIFPGSTTPTVDDAMFDAVYAVNVKAPFFLTANDRATDDRRRVRIDHQPRILGRATGDPGRRSVRLDQRSDGDTHTRVGGGVRLTRRPRQRDLSRRRTHPARERPGRGNDARHPVRRVRYA